MPRCSRFCAPAWSRTASQSDQVLPPAFAATVASLIRGFGGFGKWVFPRTGPGNLECYNIGGVGFRRIRREEMSGLPVTPSITLEAARVDTPIGPFFLAVREGTLVAASFDGCEDGMARALERRFGPVSLEKHPDPGGIVARLRAYFKGDLPALDAIKSDPGGTPFQQRVWAALRRIPVGTTLSYSALARDIGDPDAVRAVGTANGSNPVPVVIPCHRVIGADGSLTGYGGGLERKRWLLVHEGVQTQGLQVRLPFDAAR